MGVVFKYHMTKGAGNIPWTGTIEPMNTAGPVRYVTIGAKSMTGRGCL